MPSAGGTVLLSVADGLFSIRWERHFRFINEEDASPRTESPIWWLRLGVRISSALEGSLFLGEQRGEFQIPRWGGLQGAGARGWTVAAGAAGSRVDAAGDGEDGVFVSVGNGGGSSGGGTAGAERDWHRLAQRD